MVRVRARVRVTVSVRLALALVLALGSGLGLELGARARVWVVRIEKKKNRVLCQERWRSALNGVLLWGEEVPSKKQRNNVITL